MTVNYQVLSYWKTLSIIKQVQCGWPIGRGHFCLSLDRPFVLRPLLPILSVRKNSRLFFDGWPSDSVGRDDGKTPPRTLSRESVVFENLPVFAGRRSSFDRQRRRVFGHLGRQRGVRLSRRQQRSTRPYYQLPVSERFSLWKRVCLTYQKSSDDVINDLHFPCTDRCDHLLDMKGRSLLPASLQMARLSFPAAAMVSSPYLPTIGDS